MSGEGEKTVMQERKGSVDESVVSSKVPEGAVESKTGVDGATVNPGGAVDVRVAVIGNVDSGKSTLVGCLTKGVTDDGRGKARSLVFRFRHELENGRTSSVATEVMGFHGGSQVPVDARAARAAAFQTVHAKADRCVTLVDLCGHERYLKTTVFGLTALVPDYAMVIVGANMGVSRMTKEHIGIAAALKLPIIVIVTKIDIAPADVAKHSMEQVTRILRQAGKKPLLVRDSDSVDTAAKGLYTGRVAPVILCSSVTGEGLDKIRGLFNKLEPRALNVTATGDALDDAAGLTKATNSTRKGSAATDDSTGTTDAVTDTTTVTEGGDGSVVASTGTGTGAGGVGLGRIDAPPVVQIDSVFQVTGVGTVVAGSVLSGKIEAGDTMLLGPDVTGQFVPVIVRTIHVQFTPSPVATCGGTAAFAVRPKGKTDTKKGWAKKGMSLVHPSLAPKAHWEFTAEIVILHHQTTMSRGYSPVMHIGVITQAAKIIDIKDKSGAPIEALRTGDRAIVRCRFMYRPEYLSPGSILLFREGRAKGVGRVLVAGDEPTATTADLGTGGATGSGAV